MPHPKKDTQIPDGDRPARKMPLSSGLNDVDHQNYQALIVTLNWIVCLGRIDIVFATSYLSFFTAYPRRWAHENERVESILFI